MAVVADGSAYFDWPKQRIYDEGPNDISWQVWWSGSFRKLVCLADLKVAKCHNLDPSSQVNCSASHATIPRLNFGGGAMKSRKLAKSRVVKRSITIKGRASSVTLEDQFWEALKEIAKERGMTLVDLVTSIKAESERGNLSSACRLFVLRHYRDRSAKPAA